MKPLRTVAAVALSVVGLLAPVAASAAGTQYVALGDSYSAGTGTKSPVDACYRSLEGYPALVASARGWTLSYQACGSAELPEIEATQLGTLSAGTGYVTVSGGGNDAGFTDGLQECALPGWMSNCTAHLDYAERMITGTIPGRLDSLYTQIRTKAPNARRAAVGYPHLFMGEDCNALTWFSPAEQARINLLTDRLDDLTRDRAAAHGMAFVDPRAAFTGHAVCDSPEWINGLSNPTRDSYHPNDAGNVAYASLVQAALGTSTTLRTSTATAAATTEPTADAYAALLPDLASDENLARAEAAGIPRGQIRKLDRQLRSGDVATAKQAVRELKRLDREHPRR